MRVLFALQWPARHPRGQILRVQAGGSTSPSGGNQVDGLPPAPVRMCDRPARGPTSLPAETRLTVYRRHELTKSIWLMRADPGGECFAPHLPFLSGKGSATSLSRRCLGKCISENKYRCKINRRPLAQGTLPNISESSLFRASRHLQVEGQEKVFF